LSFDGSALLLSIRNDVICQNNLKIKNGIFAETDVT